MSVQLEGDRETLQPSHTKENQTVIVEKMIYDALLDFFQLQQLEQTKKRKLIQ
jgi:uncharacterized protein YjcR